MSIQISIQSLLRAVTATSFLAIGIFGVAQVPTFGGNAQHTNVYTTSAGDLNNVIWQATIDSSGSSSIERYAQPLVSANNTVIVPVRTSSTNVKLNLYDGASGFLKHTINTDYVLTNNLFKPPYEPVLCGTRLYYPGAGGTIYYIDNIDGTPTAPTQLCFYGLSTYQSDTTGFNTNVFVDSPITADSQGNLFFGFRIFGTVGPFTVPSGQYVGGYARIGSNGSGTYVMAGSMTADTLMTVDVPNAAPALSNDESTLYVFARDPADAGNAYICGLDSATLATKYERFITDPRPTNGLARPGESLTSSTVIAPDGDVYMGLTTGNPVDGERGVLAHYSGDLSREKTPGAFGADATPGIVPASMVPGYTGKSSYLLFCLYNNYYLNQPYDDGGDGINKVAILDPNDETQIDWHPAEAGMVEMREVLTAIGCTPDAANSSVKNADLWWSVTAPAVNPSTDSIFFTSSDGRAYRWDLNDDSLGQCLELTGLSVDNQSLPTCIGPQGTVYAISGNTLFAINDVPSTFITMQSSLPDMRGALYNDGIQLSVHVVGNNSGATGTVTFTDKTYRNFTSVVSTLGTVTLVHGNATLTLNPGDLDAGGPDSFNGNNFITATYSGDDNHAPASTTLVQKVHFYSPYPTIQTTPVTHPLYGQPLNVLIEEQPTASGADLPTGMVALSDSSAVLSQQYLVSNGNTTFTLSALKAGNHTLIASYTGDTEYTRAEISSVVTIYDGTTTSISASPNPGVYGQSVQLSAQVLPADAGAGTPSGSVQFFVDNASVGSANTGASGNASLSVNTLSPGAHTVYATFTGAAGWDPSTSASISEQINEGTATSVMVQPTPSMVTQLVTITATVSAADSGAGTPSGSVAFADNGANLGSANVDSSGHATITTSALGFGNRTITASFIGASGWANSNGQIVTVVRDSTTTTVTSSQNPGLSGQPLTFTAAVVSTHGVGTPTGIVSFTDNGSFLANVPLDGTGHAAFTTSTLSLGNHSIGAAYAATAAWMPSSGSLSEFVNDGTPPSVPQNVTANPGPIKGQITIQWSASTDPDDPVNHYEVWSSKKASGSFTLSGRPVTTSFVDSPGHNQARFYFVVAVDSHGNRSANSVIVSAKGL